MAHRWLDLVTYAVDQPIGIVELVAVCERFAARNRLLFERLGGWVADEADPALQRWFAVATHRHAWHAELWDGRRPAIPVDAPAPERSTEGDAGDRLAWYRSELATMRSDLTELAGRVDAVLDPGTRRVIDLVLADLDELAEFDESSDVVALGPGQTEPDGG